MEGRQKVTRQTHFLVKIVILLCVLMWYVHITYFVSLHAMR